MLTGRTPFSRRGAVWRIAVPVATLAAASVVSFVFAPGQAPARAAAPDPLAAPDFESEVRPILASTCYSCHNPEDREGHLDLKSLAGEAELVADGHLLDTLLFVVEDEEMPPRRAPRPLAEEERKTLVAWAKAAIARAQGAAPNDPGVVVMPRLNAREYDFVVRDLTGVDIGAGRFLTQDGGAGEGFLNVGAAQPMTPTHVENFLAAAHRVLSHARITPETGIAWSDAPLPEAQTAEEVRKQLVQSWTDWFGLQQTQALKRHAAELKGRYGEPIAAYLHAAWRFKHRDRLGQPAASLADIADSHEPALLRDPLDKLWAILTADPERREAAKFADRLFVKQMIERWEALPAPAGGSADAVIPQIREIARWIDDRSNDARWSVDYQPFERPPQPREVAQKAWGRSEDGFADYDLDLTKVTGDRLYLVVGDGGDGNEGDYGLWRDGVFTFADGSEKPWHTVTQLQTSDGAPVPWGSHPLKPGPKETVGVSAPSVLVMPLPQGARSMTLTLQLDPEAGKEGSIQTAVYDQPTPLPEGHIADRRFVGQKVSPKARALRQEVEALRALATMQDGYIKVRDDRSFAGFPEEQVKGFGAPWPQVDVPHPVRLFGLSAREIERVAPPEDRARLEVMRRQLASVTGSGGPPTAEEERRASEIVADFASRAWRRPVEPAELAPILSLYAAERERGAGFEFAMKTALRVVLVAPEFLYRTYAAEDGGSEVYPLDSYELASRLSFFLWGSAPDERLLELAAAEGLQTPEALAAEATRMMQDPRARALATEFAGQWLQFADFNTFSGPDAEKYPEFDDELKGAMHAQAIEFFADLFRGDGSLRNVLDSDYTFLNGRLASHYGIAGVDGPEMRRVPVPDGRRGGILGMGAVLVKTSSPLRTSPVKRGHWVYEQLLGLHMPEPPADVPLISDDETDEAGLSVPEQLAEHREREACASCHDKIDPLGLALENFDPIGRWRDTDGAGNPVLVRGESSDGGLTVDGLDGLVAHLNAQEDAFLRAFSRKLLGYALGRQVLLTDEPLIREMVAALKAGGARPSIAIEQVVTSQQFRTRRATTAAAE